METASTFEQDGSKHSHSPPEVELVAVDEVVLSRLVEVATTDAAPDDVTPPLGDGWTLDRVEWLRAFHRLRRAGLADGEEETSAISVDGTIVGATRLHRSSPETPDQLECGIWLARSARGLGLSKTVLRLLASRALAAGASRIVACTTAGNAAAVATLRRAGASLRNGPDGTVFAVVALDESGCGIEIDALERGDVDRDSNGGRAMPPDNRAYAAVSRVAAYGVCLQGGQLLLTRWGAQRQGLAQWTLPGGKVEPGEDPFDTVVREFAEETGLDVVVEKLLGVDSRVIPSVERLDHGPALYTIGVYYHVHVEGGILRPEPDGSTDMPSWVEVDSVPNLVRASLVDIGLALFRERPDTGHVPAIAVNGLLRH